MAEQYPLSSEDRARHTELSIKKATGGLTDQEEKELSDLRKRKALNNVLAGNDH